MSSPKPPLSRLANWKDYFSKNDIRASLSARVRALRPGEHGVVGGDTLHNLSQWAGQKIRRNVSDPTVNHVDLFPGWATRRPRISTQKDYQRAFDLHVHISGVATSQRTPELLTRSQRAFLRLAKTFASLPKVQPILSNQPLDPDETVRGLRLPPRPCEIPDDYDVEDLDRQFKGVMDEPNAQESDLTQFCAQQSTGEMHMSAQLQRFHENLETRMRPFWASALSARIVRISIFAHPLCADANQHASSLQPILTSDLYTGSDGFFSGTLTITWDDICAHPIGSRIAFDETSLEHELEVQAQVIEPEDSHATSTPRAARIPITQSTVRVISDIDDTIKMSRVLDGARAVFHNVFVKDLEETVIPGMAEWYGALWGRGVRFHYVSNSPYELLPVIKQFLEISGLPPGSIRLRSYTGKSLFNGILSAPATRKRANVVEVLDHFPESRFILVGDSGEQDMELYAQLAAERPDQIAGVFIRDVTTVGLEDPTGSRAPDGLSTSPKSLRKGSNGPEPGMVSSSQPVPKRAMTLAYPKSASLPSPRPLRKTTFAPSSYPPLSQFDHQKIGASRESLESSGSSGSLSADSLTSIPFQPNRRNTMPITEGEKKRWELQNRVYRARSTIPVHVPFRVFEDPRECIEAEVIVERLVAT
ncbi:hypothetical protein V8B97DRAFT_1934329 [Scleroderma yunnanense]